MENKTTIRLVSYIIDFGKYRGQLIENVPRDYLNWCLETIENQKFEAMSEEERTEFKEAIETELILRDRSHIIF